MKCLAPFLNPGEMVLGVCICFFFFFSLVSSQNCDGKQWGIVVACFRPVVLKSGLKQCRCAQCVLNIIDILSVYLHFTVVATKLWL